MSAGKGRGIRLPVAVEGADSPEPAVGSASRSLANWAAALRELVSSEEARGAMRADPRGFLTRHGLGPDDAQALRSALERLVPESTADFPVTQRKKE